MALAATQETKTTDEKVRIEIQAQQTVHYLQTVELSREDAAKLAQLYCDAEHSRTADRALADWVADLLDKRDVSDADEVEDIELALVTEDEEIDHDAFEALADDGFQDAADVDLSEDDSDE